MFISCISIFPAWYLVIYPYKIILKIFQVQKNFHSVNCFRPGGRPGRSTGPIPGQDGRPPRSTASYVQDVHACARLSVGRPVDRPKTACSLFFVGRPYRSTGPNGYLSDGLPVDRAGRPIACQKPQRLFPLWWFSENLFLLLFVWQNFLTFWGLILDHINLIKSCFYPLLSL